MKRKKLLIVGLSIVVVIIIGVLIFIFSRPRNSEATLDTFFKVHKNQVVSIKKENLKITLLSVSDSRCPKDAKCVWAGEITYVVKVNDKKLSMSTVVSRKREYENYIISLGENNSTRYVKLKVEKK